MDRRKFLTLAGITGVVAATTGGLGYLLAEIARGENRHKSHEALLQAIDSLPNSVYKDVLQEKVSPIFTIPRAATIPLHTTHIPLFDSTVADLPSASRNIDGLVKLHHFESGKPAAYNAQVTSSTPMPYPYLMAESELAQIHTDADNVPYIQIGIEKGIPVFTGVNPYIEIKSPVDNEILPSDKAFYEKKRKFVRVKEAASLFYNIAWLTAVDKLMQQNGISPTIPTFAPNGTVQNTEIFTAYNLTITRNDGRFLLFIDIAGSILALKAYEGTGMYKELHLERDYNPRILSSMPHIDLGQTPEEILRLTFQLILDSPHGENRIQYNPVFDYTKVP